MISIKKLFKRAVYVSMGVFIVSCSSTPTGGGFLVPEDYSFTPRVKGEEVVIEEEAPEPGAPVSTINQYGYLPGSPKYLFTEWAEGGTFLIQDAEGEEVFQGELVAVEAFEGDSRAVFRGDFSELEIPGEYVASIPGADWSMPFSIGEDLYEPLLADSLRTYFYQRASMAVEEDFGGRWARAAGHPDTSLTFHPTSGNSGVHSAPGGWYDAGDYGKYVVNGGISVATLLSLYEVLPESAQRIGENLNLPESGNGINDLLDEVQYELDWMKTMQDRDGGVFFKVAGGSWPGFVAPESDRMERFVIGKSTTSTLNFSAVMAQAARVFYEVDPGYADDCLMRAERAWQWAQENPTILYPDETSGSGAYNDETFEDEFFWAAAELAVLTGKPEYIDYLNNPTGAGGVNWYLNPRIDEPSFWADVQNLGYFTLAMHADAVILGTEQTQTAAIQEEILRFCDAVIERSSVNPYRIPMRIKDFAWGSSGTIGNYGVALVYGYLLSENEVYRDGVLQVLNYLLGQNATGYSMITGYGTRTAQNPHSRLMTSDGVAETIPGYVVGGPNRVQEDGLDYPFDLPEKSYYDVQDSYASNETAINWNAPFSFILGFIAGE